jgi:cell division transport system permease protein
MRSWLRHHYVSLVGSLVNLRANRGSTALSVLVIGVTLALPLGLQLVQANFRAVTTQLGAAPQASLFLELGTSLEAAEALAQTLASDARITSARVIASTDALTSFAGSTELAEIIDNLEENPLPHAVVLKFESSALHGKEGEAFRSVLERTPTVADATFDAVWIRRLEAVSDLVARTAVVFATIIGIGVVTITGNTIRVGISHRRGEIEVAKLCGATDAYVSRPFLYNGALQGLIGAVVACGIVGVANWILREPAEQLAMLYQSHWKVINISVKSCFYACLLGMIMGWVGALIAVQVYLRRLDFGRSN